MKNKNQIISILLISLFISSISILNAAPIGKPVFIKNETGVKFIAAIKCFQGGKLKVTKGFIFSGKTFLIIADLGTRVEVEYPKGGKTYKKSAIVKGDKTYIYLR